MSDETLKKVANALIACCREDREEEGLATLYAEGAVSVEAVCMPGTDSRESVGLEAIRGKHAWWNGAMEVHSASVDGPFFHGDDRFGLIFEVDVTTRETGDRSTMKELGVYTVKDGKIVREEFFYDC